MTEQRPELNDDWFEKADAYQGDKLVRKGTDTTDQQAVTVAQEGDVVRDIASETVCGLRVAAYRETHPEHGDKYGHTYSEHWSTPNTRNPAVRVERLFTETQLRAAIAASPEPVPATNQAGEVREGCVGTMDAARATYFLERFKREEKLLGPHEQWALDFTIAALATQPATSQEPDGWLAVKVNSEGGIVMPYGPLHPQPDRPNDPRYQWAPFYLGEPK